MTDREQAIRALEAIRDYEDLPGSPPPEDEMQRIATEALAALPSQPTDDRGDRLYRALAMFDTRDGSLQAALVRSAREGYERSHPDMSEDGAWSEFDSLIELESFVQAAPSDDRVREAAQLLIQEAEETHRCAVDAWREDDPDTKSEDVSTGLDTRFIIDTLRAALDAHERADRR